MAQSGDGTARERLARLLTKAMTDRRWSQAELARRAGVSPGTVSNALNSKAVLTKTTLDQLTHALGITGVLAEETYALREEADPRTQRLDHYLVAARSAVREHPYAGVLPGVVPPLASVYVSQLVRQDDLRNGTALVAGAEDAGGLRPADQILTRAATCVVLAGPGGGKSSLLRTFLTDMVGRWQADGHAPVLPVLVPASALSGLPLAEALARHANAELGGLVERLPPELFANRPHPRTRWLVLVDGLDEVTDPQTRRRILHALATVTDGLHGDRYRFVVATRSLPDGELDALGSGAPRYQLEPFGDTDLRGVARAWFLAMQLSDLDATVDRFLAAVDRAGLGELVRVPLMAAMLCQLQAVEPDQPLPTGRGYVYDRFITLLRKRQYAPSARAVLLVGLDGYGPSAVARAEEVLDHLPELIGHLAVERLNALLPGLARPMLDVLRAHPLAVRPARVLDDEWDDFLSDALCRSGLITRSGSDLVFLHQTLLEHQAALYSTRDEQARSRALDELFAALPKPGPGVYLRKGPEKDRNPSYIGFVIDALLAPGDHVSERIARMLAEFASSQGMQASDFLARQVRLGTRLPADIRGYLARFSRDPHLPSHIRIDAAEALGGEESARLLADLAYDPSLDGVSRVSAASALAGLAGHSDGGARVLADLGWNLDAASRVLAAMELAEIEGHRKRAVDLVTAVADDPGIDGHIRSWAAVMLGTVAGRPEEAAARLRAFAHDPRIAALARVKAASLLAGVEGAREEGAQLLTAFIHDPGFDSESRVSAADSLRSVEGYLKSGAALLTALVGDQGLANEFRVLAAEYLAGAGEIYREEGIKLLAALTGDCRVDDPLARDGRLGADPVS
ncbi:NACHT domain-containing protein [Streptomyces sp. NPDC058290]|uniref:NACHT domain-containing protein n=1 Tax=Streptomyces sp. NPDC058290 TaxID=3346426 RepID=UPI0036E75B62